MRRVGAKLKSGLDIQSPTDMRIFFPGKNTGSLSPPAEEGGIKTEK